ncbi:hypothetical protein LJK88_12305 [Paenibacillus sp. P26]|nr:hypothetical protein LJK88_12305 [Paenibacillus sp. P26]UUZ89457.1 hypothetical protein LJK87_25365 [Paenibacillus sp. P25]
MNKAKMTFRFEPTRPGGKPAAHRETKVIPLHQEEYRIMEPEAEGTKESRPRQNDLYERLRPPAPGPSLSPSAPESERPMLIDAQPLNPYTTDYGGWQSSFDTETQRIESMIRNSGGRAVDPETGYVEDGREPRREEELRDHRWYTPEQTAYYSRQTGGSWLKVTASVAGAVVTGVAFGFLVLSMFKGGDDPNKVKPVDASVVQQQGQKKPDAGTASGSAQGKDAGAAGSAAASASAKPGDKADAGTPVSAAVANMATAAVSLQSKSYTFLQGGVFSTPQTAETQQADFRKQGFAAVSDSGDKIPVYIGMAVSREEAQTLSQQYKQKKIDVVLKNFEVPGASKIRWNGKGTDIFAGYMTQGEKLVQLISAQTVLHLNETKPGALDDKALQTIKTTHQAWASSASAVSDGLGEAGKASLPKMNSALNTAVASLEDYKKNPSSASLWQAQTALMQYLVAEKELLRTASVQ